MKEEVGKIKDVDPSKKLEGIKIEDKENDETKVDAAFKQLGDFVDTLGEESKKEAVTAIQKAAEEVAKANAKDIPNLTADIVCSWCLQQIPGEGEKGDIEEVVKGMRESTKDGSGLYAKSTEISGACLYLGVKWDDNIENEKNDPNIKAMQQKLNAFIDLLNKNPEDLWTKEKIEGYKKELNELLGTRVKKGVEGSDGNFKLIEDGKLGIATTKVMEVYVKAMKETGKPGEKKEVKEVAPTKEQVLAADTIILESPKVEATGISIEKTTKDKTVTYSDLTFKINGSEYSLTLTPDVAGKIEKGKQLPDAVKKIPEFKGIVAEEMIAMRGGKNDNISKDEYERVTRQALNYLASDDGKFDDGKLNEILGTEVEVTDEDLKEFRENGKIIFGLDWKGGEKGYGKDDAKVELKRDGKKIAMTITVNGVPSDPKTSTEDYLKSLKGAAGTLPSVDTNKVEAAKSVLKNGTGEGADEGAKH
ncbi:MAG: hypothetical protein WC269_05990, partial [Candidatus Gracilibacteria bacterium]